MTVRNLFFDLDGTLLDTETDIHECMLATVREFGGEESAFLQAFRIGPPLGDAVAEAMPQLTPVDIDRFMKRFRERYDTSPQEKTAVYPGIPALLAAQKEQGRRLFIATNKRIYPTRRLLEMFELRDYFTDIFAVDMNQGKYTKPEMLQFGLERHGLAADESVMIGDSRSDVRAGAACRMRTIAVTWGYEPGVLLEESRPENIVTDSAALVTVLDSLI